MTTVRRSTLVEPVASLAARELTALTKALLFAIQLTSQLLRLTNWSSSSTDEGHAVSVHETRHHRPEHTRVHVQFADEIGAAEYACEGAKIDFWMESDCVSCGKEINPKRLDAVPWARYCTECQEKLERRL